MRSLFEIFDVTTIIDGAAFYISGIARASGSEAELCLYTVIIVDVINHDVALQSSFEILIFNCGFGLEFWILTPYRVGTIGKTSIFGLDSTINR